VGRGGADAESPGDAEEKVLPEEDRGLGPVAALPREGLEPGAEVGAVRVVPPGDGAHLRPHRRLPPFPGPDPLAGSHSKVTERRDGAAAVGSAVGHRSRQRYELRKRAWRPAPRGKTERGGHGGEAGNGEILLGLGFVTVVPSRKA